MWNEMCSPARVAFHSVVWFWQSMPWEPENCVLFLVQFNSYFIWLLRAVIFLSSRVLAFLQEKFQTESKQWPLSLICSEIYLAPRSILAPLYSSTNFTRSYDKAAIFPTALDETQENSRSTLFALPPRFRFVYNFPILFYFRIIFIDYKLIIDFKND